MLRLQMPMAIGFDSPTDVQLNIFNLLGQEVYSTLESNLLTKQFELDLSNYTAGTYLIMLESNGKRLTRKMIVTK